MTESEKEVQKIGAKDVGELIVDPKSQAGLYQIHHQDIKDKNKMEMVAQKEIKSHVHLQAWHRLIMIDFPLPEGCQWMICNESSKYFVKKEDIPLKE